MDPIVFFFIFFYLHPFYGSQWGPSNVIAWHSSECLLLCSAGERNSYRFGTTWGWV